MVKITRHTASAATTLTVSGRISSEHLPELRHVIDEERSGHVVLDLLEVSLVDVEVVRFLNQCELNGIRIARCPSYVREWMARENAS
jgi:hypothetical protein